VFVTGYSAGYNTSLDYATVAYDGTTGTERWVTRYNGPGNGDDGAYALGVGRHGGTVFVTGYSAGSNASFDYDRPHTCMNRSFAPSPNVVSL
jgi:hypothetical protein